MTSNSTGGSGFYLFGRDISTIPCLRTCALTGFAAGIGSTLLHFLITSKVVKSFKVGQVAFVAVTFPYWYICSEREYEKQLTIYNIQKTIAEKTDDEYIITDSLEFGPETYG